MNRSSFAPLLAAGIGFLLAFTAPTTPRKLIADKAKSVMTYTMRHPMHTWDGVSHDVQSVLVYNDLIDRIEAVAVAAKIASFDSQNANRDSHTIEVIEGLKYPRVTFTSTRIDQAGDKLNIRGNLSFHGVTKPVIIDGIRADKGDWLVATGEFPVKMSEYNVERPSLMMVPTEESFILKFSLVYSKAAVQNQ
ncbi:YceI family protein [Fibrella sp. WM1]|uniref:YceI family protein n=1 Tax=Spirosoma sordidisoli TaxID=2502893 RepID=A0A4Q2UEJ9_9BACT|nr:YceI family protein [Spirosoma sordidisoli]RYC66722.1 YceI family protein [Spirosoma sordidisoli]